MTGQPVQITDLTVRYGRATAVNGVSLDVSEGSVFALLGRNGAGKSSLVRCLLGLRRPDGGSVRVFGEDAWRRRAAMMKRVGVVSEEPDAPPTMTARQLAIFTGRLYERWDAASVAARLERFHVPQDVPYGRLSKGQKKQVSLALALGSKPDLLILDDPSLGLDVVARREFFEELIGTLAEDGTSVLVTTHDLSSIEGIADHVAVLREGRLVLSEPVETLKDRFRRVTFSVPYDAASQAQLARLAALGVRQWGRGVQAVVSRFDEAVLAEIAHEGAIREVEVSSMSLEEIFVAISAEGGAA